MMDLITILEKTVSPGIQHYDVAVNVLRKVRAVPGGEGHVETMDTPITYS